MSRHTVELLERYQPEEVVAWCPSCIWFYDEILHAELPFPVRHATEFLVSRLPELTFTHEVDARVALHYHVHSEARRREGLAGRRLLEAVPGLRLVELEPDPRFGRILATNYHGCQRLLCPFEAERPIAIEHYLSVFARGLVQQTFGRCAS